MATMDDILYGKGMTAVDRLDDDLGGGGGTKPMNPSEVMVTIQTSSLVVAIIVACAATIYLQFVLVPLIMAYFVTFLMAPIQDIFEKRPYVCSGKELCVTKMADVQRWELKEDGRYYLLADNGEAGVHEGMTQENFKGAGTSISEEQHNQNQDRFAAENPIADFLATGKLPHIVACICTLAVCIAGLAGVGSIIGGSLGAFGANELAKEACTCDVCEGTMKIVNGKEVGTPKKGIKLGSPGFCGRESTLNYKLMTSLNNLIDTLEIDYGMKIVRQLVCPPLHTEKLQVTMSTTGDDVSFKIEKIAEVMKRPIDWTRVTDPDKYNNMTGTGNLTVGCKAKELFGSSEGSTFAELTAQIAAVGVVINDIVLILMLAIYILLERPEGRTIQGDHLVAMRIEDMIKNYISLKTALSAGTGVVCGGILIACGIPMAPIFGLLAFLLNYIPMVGSLISSVLPLPIVFLDDSLSETAMIMAFVGPIAVQLYVGNALEPAVFGASLNLTAMSILLGLTFFAAVWGMYGAVLSVPILAAVKINLHHIDHPLASAMLKMIREDASFP